MLAVLGLMDAKAVGASEERLEKTALMEQLVQPDLPELMAQTDQMKKLDHRAPQVLTVCQAHRGRSETKGLKVLQVQAAQGAWLVTKALLAPVETQAVVDQQVQQGQQEQQGPQELLAVTH